jgi:hypothetical protein
MSPDRVGEPKNEPRPEERKPRERTVAPPIEREHETQEGVVEEEREREPDRPRRDPDRT